MMSDFRDDLLVEMLDCGYGDLYLLEDCKYEIGDLVEYCRWNFGKIEINLLVRSMFEFGFNDIRIFINDRIEDLDDVDGNTDEENEELEALKKLNPNEDFESFHNYIDTHVWIEHNEDIYRKYLKGALDEFEEMTGFCIENWS